MPLTVPALLAKSARFTDEPASSAGVEPSTAMVSARIERTSGSRWRIAGRV